MSILYDLYILFGQQKIKMLKHKSLDKSLGIDVNFI